MAPRRPDKKSKKRAAAVSRAAGGGGGAADASASEAQTISPTILLKAAEHHLSEGNAADALTLAKTAFDTQTAADEGRTAAADPTLLLPSLSMLGQINLELGELADAKACFLKAAEIDPQGTIPEVLGGGAEKFLCLAQLSDEGGADSVGWFERGAAALKAQIQRLEAAQRTRSPTSSAAAAIRKRRNGSGGGGGKVEAVAGPQDETEMELALLKKKLAMALCSVAEVYMTDLSWEPDAEQRCESLVTEATLVAPESAESWQTLASVRVSQDRRDDAMAALTRSLDLWRDLPPDDPLNVPDFPTRVALARLLLEVEMEADAIEVLERLVGEDDHSVEVWYLGGWGLYILGEKQKQLAQGKAEKTNGKAVVTGKAAVGSGDINEQEEDDWKSSWASARVWLNQSQHLYKMQDYEDERLGAHAKELLDAIAQELGEVPEGEDGLGDEDGDEGWEDDDDDEEGSDDEMKG